MKIQLTTAYKQHKSGAILDLSDEEAEGLISRGIALLYRREKDVKSAPRDKMVRGAPKTK